MRDYLLYAILAISSITSVFLASSFLWVDKEIHRISYDLFGPEGSEHELMMTDSLVKMRRYYNALYFVSGITSYYIFDSWIAPVACFFVLYKASDLFSSRTPPDSIEWCIEILKHLGSKCCKAFESRDLKEFGKYYEIALKVGNSKHLTSNDAIRTYVIRCLFELANMSVQLKEEARLSSFRAAPVKPSIHRPGI